jgi:O-antigen/teichoic acid export membrane protein
MSDQEALSEALGEREVDVLDTAEAGRRVLLGGALRVMGYILGIGASVAAAAFVTRHLGTEDYGRYQSVVALVTIVQFLTDMGMETLGMREYSQRDGAARERFMRVLLGLRLFLTVVGVGAMALVAWAIGYDGQMIAGSAVMGLGIIVAVMAGTLGIPLAAGLRLQWVTALDVARQLVTALLSVGLVVAGAGIVGFLAVPIPAYGVVLAGTLLLVRGTVSLRPIADRRMWLSLVRPAIAFALATATGAVYVYAAQVLTELSASHHEAGLFGASFRVYIILASVPGLLVTTAFPVLSRAARDDRDRLAYATQRLFEGTALLGGAALLGCVLGAAPVIDVVGGARFADAAPVLRVQGVALALTFVIATWGFTLLALRLHRQMIVANLVALAVSVTTVLLLARSHGAQGAAFGTLLGEIVLSTGYVFGLARHDARMRPRLGRVARLAPALGLALAAGLLVPVPDVVATVLGLAVYGVAALLLGAVPDEVRDRLPGPLSRVGLRADVA